MTGVYEKLRHCVEQIRKKTDFIPETALILGSGLGGFAQYADVAATVSYDEIEGFPVSTVSGHQGQFVFGTIGGVPLVIMQGRVHYYEGYPMQDVVLPVRVMGMLGAKRLILTNAAGGINPAFRQGGLMLLSGHISSLVPSPLIGGNLEELGARFPDMTEVYDRELRMQALRTAENLGIPLHEGVYLQTTGPNYETPEEIRMFERWGADAVGMSTACEAMAAKHMGMKICGISCITNMAAGLGEEVLRHEDVKVAAAKAETDFSRLLLGILQRRDSK